MKPLHKAASTDSLHPAMMCIQVKDGFAYATNGAILIKLPVTEVFAETIKVTEELYFDAQEFAKANFHKAVYIGRTNLVFQAKDRNLKVIGTLIAKNAKQFTTTVGKFPDCNAVIPDATAELISLTQISINPKLYLDVCTALGSNDSSNLLYFFGATKPVIIKSSKSSGLGLIMPLKFKDGMYPAHPFRTEETDEDIIG